MSKAEEPRRNHVGTISLLVAVIGAVASRGAIASGWLAESMWSRLLEAGFEAAVVGALADWFAVTALFRHPLGLPIPHTAILRTRREKLIAGIETTIREDWLSPEVVRKALERVTPSDWIVTQLRDSDYAGGVGSLVRDALGRLIGLTDDPRLANVLDNSIRRQLAEVPIDETLGERLGRTLTGERRDQMFRSLALTVANLAAQPETADQLDEYLERAAEKLAQGGQRLVPFFLRRSVVRRSIVEAACTYGATELNDAARRSTHPLREGTYQIVDRFLLKLANGDPEALERVRTLRAALLRSLESRPLVANALARLRSQIERDLATPSSDLSRLIDSKVPEAILEYFDDPSRRNEFDQRARSLVVDLVERHHHLIGEMVRKNLEDRDPDQLINDIEDRVGPDLQFIRLNGAVVGGLIGVLLSLVKTWLG